MLFTILFVTTSCSTDEDGPITIKPDAEMMDDDDDNKDPADLVDAPSFSVKTTADDVLDSKEFEDRNLVIFFFGYNCPPCKSVGPSIESELFQKFVSNENFAMIGVDQWDGNNAGVNSFQSTTGITFPLGVKGSQMAKDFETSYDRLVVVNAAGKIVYKGNSIARNNLDEVIDIVTGLLEE